MPQRTVPVSLFGFLSIAPRYQLSPDSASGSSEQRDRSQQPADIFSLLSCSHLGTSAGCYKNGIVETLGTYKLEREGGMSQMDLSPSLNPLVLCKLTFSVFVHFNCTKCLYFSVPCYQSEPRQGSSRVTQFLLGL